MKRNAVIAALTAVAVIGGGAAAVAVSSGDDAPATASPADRVSLVSGQESAAPADRDDDRDAKDEDDRDDRDDRRDDDKDDQDDRRDDKGAAAGPGNVTAAQAIAAALKHTSGTVLSADLDDDGDRRWEVEVATGGSTVHEIDVDSTTGKVVRTETDRDEDDAAAELKAVQGAKVSARDAAAAVDGAVTSVEFDDGRWEVEVGEADWTVPLDTPRASREG
ncbi:PepSY domain-containing protein [Streptomyces albidoflavus]|uniref:PepSY domain-containing protein n=1 Tax=Streptomyces TaxID=1883 RepID=UPI0004C8BB9E|nr:MULTISPECIES: PepSY domain-containing protein [Streptomyces]MBL0776166.1 PepSY domain-containing protein [Streptomyces albidoflavus]MBL0799446.1 PepSY domain-containing protein [Streptomyces albidoflavus]MBV1956020.1 PepSY domain-containing protein [Streptomyces sp. BV333]MCK2140891.1 PepSY domain-containing protein [Streptomyces sp. WAC00276]MCQ9705518.1 PepSY domain-containing protein [Streptomyces sp. BSP1]